jgi:thiamine-monophosphate kinase
MHRATHKLAKRANTPASEQELIERIGRMFGSAAPRGLLHGIGDDGAVLAGLARGRQLVVSCDAFLENVHFRAGTHPAESVGYKCLARAVSDLAAMGAEPKYFLLSIALPVARTAQWLKDFLRGLRRAAREMRIALAGGDTSCWPQVAIQVTVIGEIEAGRAVLRSGARPGDLIHVTGQLGAAQLGLEVLGRGRQRHTPDQLNRDPILRAHLYPRIPLALARWLARRRVVTSMMDLSDGLSMDLPRLCAASAVGARIWIEKLPLARVPRARQKLGLDPQRMALHGGEDYALLFTVPKSRLHQLLRAPQAHTVTQIGEITTRHGIMLVDGNGSEKRLEIEGWDPFRRKTR